MLEDLEATIIFERELTNQDLQRIEQNAVDMLGGPERAYAELRKNQESCSEYKLLIRRK